MEFDYNFTDLGPQESVEVLLASALCTFAQVDGCEIQFGRAMD